MRQEDGVALAVGQTVEAAKLMRHRVHVPQTGVVEGHPGKILGVGHAFTGFHVLTVGHGLAQVLGNQTDGLFRAASVIGVVLVDTYASMACVRASIPVAAVRDGGIPTIRTGVIDRDVGGQEPVTMDIFTWRSLSVITQKRVSSEAVPAVVLMAM